MKSILHRLYNGEISPAEQIRLHSSEYLALQEKICIERDYIKQKLSKEDSTRFELLETLYLDASAMEEYAEFSNGFKMGLLLGIEVLR